MSIPTRSPGPARPRVSIRQAWMRALDHVVLLGSIAGLLSLGYLLFVVLSGALAAPLIAGTELVQVTRNVELAKAVFLRSLWVAALAAMVRHYRSDAVGYVAFLAGAACWGILPLVVRTRVPDGAAYQLMQLGQSLVSSFHASGGALMIVGFLRVVVGRVLFLASPTHVAAIRLSRLGSASAEIAAESVEARPSVMRRCWELYFCRSSLRRHCPRFLEGVSCWRKRSGCYCDQGLATRLLNSMGGETRLQVAEEMEVVRRPAAQRPPARQTIGRRKSKKVLCGECPLYLEHQKYKYRMLSWLSYPTGAIAIGALAGYIRAGYQWVDFRLGSLLAEYQVLPHALSNKPLEAAPWLSAENAIVLVIGVVVVGVILQLTELALFRFNW